MSGKVEIIIFDAQGNELVGVELTRDTAMRRWCGRSMIDRTGTKAKCTLFDSDGQLLFDDVPLTLNTDHLMAGGEVNLQLTFGDALEQILADGLDIIRPVSVPASPPAQDMAVSDAVFADELARLERL